jgi:hypothetical protein
MDEIKISDLVRSGEWVEAEYLYTADNTKYTYGSQEAAPSQGGGGGGTPSP